MYSVHESQNLHTVQLYTIYFNLPYRHYNWLSRSILQNTKSNKSNFSGKYIKKKELYLNDYL